MGNDQRDAGEDRGRGLNGAQRLNGLNDLNHSKSSRRQRALVGHFFVERDGLGVAR